MAIEFATLKSHQVARDDSLTWRLYDAFGPSAVKVIENFEYLNTDDTTGDPTAYTMTVVEAGAGNSTAVLTTTAGGALLITSAANENDGVSLQVKGEAFQLASGYPTYFGIELAINDVDQTDFIAGLCITDTTLLGGMTDGAYFRSVDGSADVAFVLEKDSVEAASSGVDTMADDTYVTLEFYYDGSNITAYVDGAEAASVASTSTSFPDNEVLTPSIEFLTGEATANTCTVRWMRAIQIQSA